MQTCLARPGGLPGAPAAARGQLLRPTGLRPPAHAAASLPRRASRRAAVRASASASPGAGAPAPGGGDTPRSGGGPNEGLADRLLGLPLLLSSRLSHVNSAYIKMRRRRKWWSKLGGYPKVPSAPMDHLPEPAIELWHKVVPLGLIFFAASFNLTVLQSLKDSIVVTAGGAETLPFLMSLCVLPASVGFFVLYGSLVSRLPERAVFYAAVAPLLAFYAVFAAVIYPASPALHFDAAGLLAGVPTGLHGLVKVVSNWTYSLFFCFAELWGSVVISVLFWSLANETVTVDEAKAVYPFMAIGANIALVAAGCFIRAVNAALPAGSQLLGLRVLVGSVLVMSVAMFAAKAFIDSRILEPMARREEAALAAAAAGGDAAAIAAVAEAAAPKKGGKKKKDKGTFSENFAVLKSSAKIRNLALLVMGYGVAHRLFEFAWKGQLRVLHPTVQGYQSVLADVSTYTGILTLASMVLSRLVFQHLGWGVAASVTPAVMGAAGVVFFGATLLGGGFMASALPEHTAAAMVGVGSIAGIVTQVFARSSKYSLFDPAKEMVYIELDKDEKRRGKAAVDLVGSQIGKSGASWITQAALLGCGSMAAAMPFTGVVFVVVIGLWIHATLELHRQMQETERVRLAEAEGRPAAVDMSYEESDSPSPSPPPAGSAAEAAAAAAAVAAAAATAAADDGRPAGAPSPQPPTLADALNGAPHNGSREGGGGAAAGAGGGSGAVRVSPAGGGAAAAL
ncbi:hypothetical protein Rsub_13004 [Raphidocelis subcapitata]|uniref:ADP,ATP carrier protein n=1 Tax=Raphidocelis subcapitata TaxID=307507 RepID=A0A2V0PRR7_9CHLO|nr:hypothetical protein Rsub_13004 [Raphidocelis subcapitata]|eukprot:GBG00278.1 hypothetical protein Rsub_13004 [Raphidocelis subcapitata]